MPLFAANPPVSMSDSAALSVLVLAWDEAAPAIRTVVAAAPAVGSLLVLLPPLPPASAPPTGPTAASPSSPLPPAAPVEAVIPLATTTAPVTAVATGTTVAAPITPTPPQPAAPGASTAEAIIPSVALGAALPLPSAPAQLAAPTPAVRLLHLVDNPLALLARSSAFQVPAAPYLGATPVTLVEVRAISMPAPAVPLAARAAVDESISSPPLSTSAAPELAPSPSPTVSAELLVIAAELPATAEAESEALAEPAPDGTVPALADAAFRADEILDPDPMQELQAAPLTTPAATEADSLALRDTLPAAYGPFGLRIPERQPVLAEPTSAPARAPVPDEEEPLPAEPAPAAPLYTAPDLNTQIIRYARQAVQTALAEGTFEAIYAPAWPTWLAAIELRQRSGRPLVLHLTALAAGRQSADTAAGWPAEIQRQALRQADLVLVETYSLARRLRRELGLANNVVRVVPAGDTAAIARALRRAKR